MQSKIFTDSVAEKFSEYLKDKPDSGNSLISNEQLNEIISATVPQLVDQGINGVRKSLIEFDKNQMNAVDEIKQDDINELNPVAVEIKQGDINEPIEVKVESVNEPMEENSQLIEDFVLVENNNPERFSPIKSLLSLFKPFKNPQQTRKEIPQEKLNEMVNQLNDMGFYDNEANIKALKFHYGFNEGLDAVIEDLLIQSADKPEQ